jgi:hypothetical protein
MLKNILKLKGVQKLRKNEQLIISGGAPPRCISDAMCIAGEECVSGQCIFIDC